MVDVVIYSGHSILDHQPSQSTALGGIIALLKDALVLRTDNIVLSSGGGAGRIGESNPVLPNLLGTDSKAACGTSPVPFVRFERENDRENVAAIALAPSDTSSPEDPPSFPASVDCVVVGAFEKENTRERDAAADRGVDCAATPLLSVDGACEVPERTRVNESARVNDPTRLHMLPVREISL